MKGNNLLQLIYKYKYPLFFILIGIIYLLNMFIDIMEVDAAQYANMSRQMMQSGQYLQVHENGQDYLDKPPLLFWLASLSFKIFGVSNFTYKLPAVLLIIFSLYSTYCFAVQWYDKRRAITAALILATTQAFFLITNDVRTDGILTSLVIFSVWQLSIYVNKQQLKGLILGAIGLALAMMTKGPIAVIIIGSAIGGDLLLQRKWRAIFDPKWILLVFVVLLLLLPMCYGLYEQYDLHPEKTVYGLKGPSGVKFFFWTQSFGRITGDIYWDNNAGYFFFFQSILWDFQPWVLLMIPALISRIVNLFRVKLKTPEAKEYITLSGFVLSFVALSLSKYKLPHYIFPLFPFLAIITSDFIISFTEVPGRISRLLSRVQFGLIQLFFLVIFIDFLFFFPPSNFLLPIIVLTAFILCWYGFIKVKNLTEKIIIPTLIMIIAFGFVMSTNFYPHLLKYQSDGVAGKEMAQKHIQPGSFYNLNVYGSALDFYYGRSVPPADSTIAGSYKEGTFIYTDEAGYNGLVSRRSYSYKIVKTYDDFHVSGLTIPFLFKSTRDSAIQKRYLLEKY